MKTLAKILRIVAIVLLGLTAVITVLSGIGITCAAFAAEKYGDTLAPLIPYKWLYQIFVVVTLAIGIAAIVGTVGLILRKHWAYSAAIITLVVGIVAGGIHIYTSRTLRGGSMPNDIRVYAAVLTLLVLLVLRIPGLWSHLGLGGDKPGSVAKPTGATLIVMGMATLSTPLWVGTTHILVGYNWVNVLLGPLVVGGIGMVLLGMGLLALSDRRVSLLVRRIQQAPAGDGHPG